VLEEPHGEGRVLAKGPYKPVIRGAEASVVGREGRKPLPVKLLLGVCVDTKGIECEERFVI
jgi:hypothetical protein